MDKITRIGIFYEYNENWIGGTYYVENLLHAILENGKLPNGYELKVYLSNSDYGKRLIEIFGDHALKIILLEKKLPFIERIANKVFFYLFKKYAFTGGLDLDVDCFFPNPPNGFPFDVLKVNSIYWIPDFQESYMPELFSRSEIRRRKMWIKKIPKNSNVVLSSQSCSRDFHSLYPDHGSKSVVIPFAVTISQSNGINIKELHVRYGIQRPYFICCNQFWAHKDQRAVLDALLILKGKGIDCEVVFTGKTSDFRDPNYFSQLNNFVVQSGLSESVKFLGFIPRDDQIMLVSNAICVLQPSNFEGWSTIVEDCKCLNKEVVLSDIDVHKEQLPDYNGFFKVGSEQDLARKMILAIRHQISKPNVDYSSSISQFRDRFLCMVDEVSRE